MKPMTPWISKMFRMHKTLDVITLFHKSSAAPSVRVANLLKQASANKKERETFELEITEAAPTADQLGSILEYVGAGKAAQLVPGASGRADALRRLKENPDSFVRPVVVDWNQGKAVIGEHESEILKLVRELPSESAQKP